MKKIFLMLMLLFSFYSYSQNHKVEKKQLEKELEDEISKGYGKYDEKKVKDLRKQIKYLNSKVEKNIIDSTKTVEYDFKQKEYTKSNVIPIVGEPLVLKIKNINRLAYDVSIKSSDVAIVDEYFNDEIKTATKLIGTSGNIPIIENRDIKNPSITEGSFKDKKDANNATSQTVTTTKLNDTIKKYTNLIKGKIAEKNQLEEVIKLINSKLETLNPIDSPDIIKIEKAELSKKMNEIKDLNNSISKLESLINDNNNQIVDLENTEKAIQLTFSRLKESYNEILLKYADIRNNEFEYQNFRQCALNPLLNYEQYLDKVKDENFIYHKLFKFRSNVLEFNKSINSFNSLFYLSMNDWKILDKLNDASKDNLRTKYQQIKDEVDKIKNTVEELDLSTKILKTEAIHTVLSNIKAYEIVSAPIQPFEDYVTFDVEIKHRDSKQLAEYDDNRKFTYMEYTKGGVRFDFSVGAVFNFGGNNNKYEIRDVQIDNNGEIENKKQIVLTDKNDFTPMLSGMFHTSFRRNGIYAFGLTLGASINVETFQLNSLFPGISLLIGKKQKFVLTAGPAFRQVDVLKNNYQEGENYDIGEFTDTSQLTSKQFKIGGFVGITYNLTQKQRGKFKINGSE